jgi:hypothetical protein
MRSKMILFKILLITTSSVMPHRLLHKLRSSFFGIVIIIPSFHSLGNLSFCQISWNRGRHISAVFEESSFSISAGMLSEHAAFLFYIDFIV